MRKVKEKIMENGSLAIHLHMDLYGFEDKWYFVPESINELEIVPVEKKTICRYTEEMLSDGRRLHEFDKVEVKDADGNKILG